MEKLFLDLRIPSHDCEEYADAFKALGFEDAQSFIENSSIEDIRSVIRKPGHIARVCKMIGSQKVLQEQNFSNDLVVQKNIQPLKLELPGREIAVDESISPEGIFSTGGFRMTPRGIDRVPSSIYIAKPISKSPKFVKMELKTQRYKDEVILLGLLGHGSSGQVYKGLYGPSMSLVALKFVEVRNPAHCKQIVVELKGLYSLSKHSLDDEPCMEHDVKGVEELLPKRSLFISFSESRLSGLRNWFESFQSKYLIYVMNIIIGFFIVQVVVASFVISTFASYILFICSVTILNHLFCLYKSKPINENGIAREMGNKSSDIKLGSGLVHIVEFYDAYTDADRGAVCLVLAYMSGGSLQNVIDAKVIPTENDIAVISYSILLALRELHTRGIIHRDVKPGNILFNSEGVVKLSDFGIMRELPPSMIEVNTFLGTLAYMSPERITASEYSVQSDIWSLGMTIISILSCDAPYSGEPGYWGLIEAIQKGEMLLNIKSKLQSNPILFNFLEECLHPEPVKRPTCHVLLKHPFIERAISRKILNPDETPTLKGLKVPPTSQDQIDHVFDAMIELTINRISFVKESSSSKTISPIDGISSSTTSPIDVEHYCPTDVEPLIVEVTTKDRTDRPLFTISPASASSELRSNLSHAASTVTEMDASERISTFPYIFEPYASSIESILPSSCLNPSSEATLPTPPIKSAPLTQLIISTSPIPLPETVQSATTLLPSRTIFDFYPISQKKWLAQQMCVDFDSFDCLLKLRQAYLHNLLNVVKDDDILAVISNNGPESMEIEIENKRLKKILKLLYRERAIGDITDIMGAAQCKYTIIDLLSREKFCRHFSCSSPDERIPAYSIVSLPLQSPRSRANSDFDGADAALDDTTGRCPRPPVNTMSHANFKKHLSKTTSDLSLHSLLPSIFSVCPIKRVKSTMSLCSELAFGYGICELSKSVYRAGVPLLHDIMETANCNANCPNLDEANTTGSSLPSKKTLEIDSNSVMSALGQVGMYDKLGNAIAAEACHHSAALPSKVESPTLPSMNTTKVKMEDERGKVTKQLLSVYPDNDATENEQDIASKELLSCSKPLLRSISKPNALQVIVPRNLLMQLPCSSQLTTTSMPLIALEFVEDEVLTPLTDVSPDRLHIPPENFDDDSIVVSQDNDHGLPTQECL